MSPPAVSLPGPRGTLRGGKTAELRLESGILGVPGSAYCFFLRRPIYGGFAYLALSRWVLGANAHPAERPPEPQGTPRRAKER